MEKKENVEIVARLDSIIGLLSENMIASGLIGKGRAVEILNDSGLGPTDIGKIFHLPATSIGSILNRQKKQKGKKKSK